jgi:uncharacterized membrane protein YebE (DUF533 family)
MKTNDLIQLAALGLVAYLAYQKYAQAKTSSVPSLPLQPSVQLPGAAPVPGAAPDFGVTNPNDSSWGDASLQAVIEGAAAI